MEPCIRTWSGELFYFLEPEKSKIHIEDIAYALAHICRFNGHTSDFYSVAQHSVRVSEFLPKRLAFEGLMHDAAEAYLGDVASPLKQLLPDYKKLELSVEKVIFKQFGIEFPLDPKVKEADRALLLGEQRDLMGLEIHIPEVPMVKHLTPKGAMELFLKRYEELT